MDGIYDFSRVATDSSSAGEPDGVLHELAERMKSDSFPLAAAQIEARFGCRWYPYAPERKYLIFGPAGRRVLELGAGVGDDTLYLSRFFSSTVTLVPDRLNAWIVQKRVQDAVRPGVKVAVQRDLSRLPLPDASVDAIVMEDVARSGFRLTTKGFGAVVHEWRRVLSPGGTVTLGIGNPIDRFPGIREIRAVFKSGRNARSLDRLVRDAAARSSWRSFPARAIIQKMQRCGFERPEIHAPLPDEHAPRVMLPVNDPTVVRYFLNNLVRRNSLHMRIAAMAAGVFSDLGFLDRVVPYRYCVFRRGGQGHEIAGGDGHG